MNLGLIIYIIEVLGAFNSATNIIIWVLSIFIVIYIIFSGAIIEEEVYGLDEKSFFSILKKLFLVLFFLVLSNIITPTKEASYKILVASQVTEENFDKIEDKIKSTSDYIFEKVKEIK